MSDFLTFVIIGLAFGCVYALAASGIVVTYTTSGIFNFAHGGIGMILAFAYWDLSQNHGWPSPLALIAVLGLLAPAVGVVIESVLMRRLHGTSTGTALVVSLGLLLTLIGLANIIWDQTVARSIPEFFAGHAVKLAGLRVPYHRILIMLVTIAVAVGLRLLFYRTRAGIAMRAVVDDPELAALNGAAPVRVAQMSWALSAMLAGLSFILIAPLAGSMEVLALTLGVLNAFAATVLGRLKSLPLTFAGALLLGVSVSLAVGYLSELPGGDSLTRIQPAIPTILLFVFLLSLPQARLRAGRVVSAKAPRVPGLRQSIAAGVAMVALVWALVSLLAAADVIRLGQGLSLGLIMLSLVLLSGWGGQVSLCQMTFVGLGAFTFGKLAAGGSPLGLVPAVAVAGAVGAMVALFAVRVQALYLALTTLAFAQAMDLVFFQDARVFGFGGRLPIERLDVPGISFAGDRAYVVLLAAVFAAVGVFILWLRRGPFGRRLSAMSDSPAACATLGISLTTTKLVVFGLSAAMAGLAGVFLGGLKTGVGPTDFEMLQSLVLLLLAMMGGITTVLGAFLGGLFFALIPFLQEHVSWLRTGQLQFLLAGLGAMSLARSPHGTAGQIADAVERLRAQLAARRAAPAGPEIIGPEVEKLARAAS